MNKISDISKLIIKDLSLDFSACNVESIEDKLHLAAQVINYAIKNHYTQLEAMIDVIKILIDVGIFSAWDEFYMCYFSSTDRIVENESIRFMTIYGRYTKVDYYLTNVTQMNDLFNDKNLGAGLSPSLVHNTFIKYGFDSIYHSMLMMAGGRMLFAELFNNKLKFINIITAACNLSNIDPVEFLKNFGYRDSSNNNADSATIARYLRIIQALLMNEPSMCKNGLSSLAWRKAMSYGANFKYSDMFTEDSKLCGAIQKQSQTYLKKVWIYNNDPNLLLISTDGYNFLTTREIINKDLGLNI